jgi:hypothetical protein
MSRRVYDMLNNAFEGIVENGAIRLRGDVSLPESTKVYVIVAEPKSATPIQIRSPRLVVPQQANDFRKQVIAETTDNAGV